MDKGTKIIIVIAAICLFLMLISLGRDLFSNKSPSQSKAPSVVSQIKVNDTASVYNLTYLK